MPTVDEIKFYLSSGGSVFAPHAHRRTLMARDLPPILREHNEAEWESTMAFLEREQRAADKAKRQAAQAPDLTVRIRARVLISRRRSNCVVYILTQVAGICRASVSETREVSGSVSSHSPITRSQAYARVCTLYLHVCMHGYSLCRGDGA